MSTPVDTTAVRYCLSVFRLLMFSLVHVSSFSRCSPGWAYLNLFRSITDSMFFADYFLWAIKDRYPYSCCLLLGTDAVKCCTAFSITGSIDADRDIPVGTFPCPLMSLWYYSHHSFCPFHHISAPYSTTVCTAAPRFSLLILTLGLLSMSVSLGPQLSWLFPVWGFYVSWTVVQCPSTPPVTVPLCILCLLPTVVIELWS